MRVWKIHDENIAPGESIRVVLVKRGKDGWEPWHIEKTETGWRTIWFKKPIE